MTTELLSEQHQYNIASELVRASLTRAPRLFMDGDQWCALYGDNLQDGVAGFGPTPRAACDDFDFWWDHGRPHPGIHPEAVAP